MLKGIDCEVGKYTGSPRTTTPTYQLSAFMEDYLKTLLNHIPPMSFDKGAISSDATTVEALLEIMGYNHTVRVKARPTEDDLGEIGDDVEMLWPHMNQFVLKCRSEETAMLLAVRFDMIDGGAGRRSVNDMIELAAEIHRARSR
ncbi:MAG: hypothetical protein EOO77_47945 [Oxalobacteraceae bacterium]|nr:MAG: hypothetical protein EOO77_47945 [Oxalobacteraceae bacterium]